MTRAFTAHQAKGVGEKPYVRCGSTYTPARGDTHGAPTPAELRHRCSAVAGSRVAAVFFKRLLTFFPYEHEFPL